MEISKKIKSGWTIKPNFNTKFDLYWKCRPVIKENTAHVVAARQNNFQLLWHVISMKLNISKKIT